MPYTTQDANGTDNNGSILHANNVGNHCTSNATSFSKAVTVAGMNSGGRWRSKSMDPVDVYGVRVDNVMLVCFF